MITNKQQNPGIPWKEDEQYPISLTNSDIKKFIKHRHPFLLLDRAIILNKKTCTSCKCISASDYNLVGHFPHQPVMPGVLQVEAMAQSACLLANYHTRHIDLDRNTLFASIDSAYFYGIVSPGDRLDIHTELKIKSGSIAQFESYCEVNETVVAKAEFKAALKFTEEYTFAMIKPNAFMHREHIMDIIRSNGLEVASYYEESSKMTIPARKVVNITRDTAEKFYIEHKEKPFFDQLCNFITMGPSEVFILKGENAISKYRHIIGATDPKDALPGTIRSIYGKSIDENAVHGSDSAGSAKREIEIHFPNFTYV